MTTEQGLQNALAMLAFYNGKPVQFLNTQMVGTGWSDVFGTPFWCFDKYLYRPKPEPVTRPWSKPEDVPGPVCWVRNRALAGNPLPVGSLIVCVERWGVTLGANQTLAEWDVFETLEYSTDRKTWRKCEVTEP